MGKRNNKQTKRSPTNTSTTTDEVEHPVPPDKTDVDDVIEKFERGFHLEDDENKSVHSKMNGSLDSIIGHEVRTKKKKKNRRVIVSSDSEEDTTSESDSDSSTRKRRRKQRRKRKQNRKRYDSESETSSESFDSESGGDTDSEESGERIKQTKRINPILRYADGKYLAKFEGKNVKRFLRDYEEFADDLGATETEKVRGIVSHVDSKYRNVIREMKGSKRRDWSKLKKEIKSLFQHEQQLSLSSLNRVLMKRDLLDYEIEFEEVATILEEKGLLTKKAKREAFLQNLEAKLKELVYNVYTGRENYTELKKLVRKKWKNILKLDKNHFRPNYGNKEERKCSFCDSTEHLRRDCEELKKALRNGRVTIMEGKLYRLQDGKPELLPFNYGKGGMKNLLEEVKAKTLHVNVHYKDENISSDPNAYDNYSTVDLESNNIRYDSQEGPVMFESEEEDLFSIMYSSLQEEEEYEATVEMKRRIEESSDEDELLPTAKKPMVSFERNKEKEHTKTTMKSQETPKREIKSFIDPKPPQYRLVNDLDDEKSKKSALRKLLETPIALTMQETLAIAPSFRREVAKKLANRRVPIENNDKPSQATRGVNVNHAKVLYAAETCTVEVSLNGSSKIAALSDDGSQLNLLSEDLQKEMNLPMERNIPWTLNTVTSEGKQFTGVCHDVEVNVGGIVVKQAFFITPMHNMKVILGRPWEKMVRALKENRSDDSTWMTIRSPHDGKTVELLICKPNDPRNRTSIHSNRRTMNMFLRYAEQFPVVAEKSIRSEEGSVLLNAGTYDFKSFVNNLALHDRVADNEFRVSTKRKTVKQKVKPAAVPLPSGVKPDIPVLWETRPPVEDVEPGKEIRLTDERVKLLNICPSLSQEERTEWITMLKRREKALAFEDADMGLLLPHIEGPVKIYTVPHVPWKYRRPNLAQKEQEVSITILKHRLFHLILEPSCGPYSNRWFVIPKKKPGQYRFIQDLQPANKVIIRDAGNVPRIEEILEKFGGYPIYSTLDLYSGYDQIPLHEDSRDLTALDTPLGLLRMTRLPQGMTNSVAIFQRVMSRVLHRHIGKTTDCFVDDISSHGRDRKKDETIVKPGIRKYVLDHINDVEEILSDLQYAGLTVSCLKSYFGYDQVVILGTICNQFGRIPESGKVEKIRNFPTPVCVTEVRSLLGMAGYYRNWIPYYAEIVAPLTNLTRKNVDFDWTQECEDVLQKLIEIFSTFPILRSPEYDIEDRPLILGCDASIRGIGGVLAQCDENGKRYACKFIGRKFNDVEQRYPAIKREMLGILYCIKACRYYVYGRFFILETDCKPLVYIVNSRDTLRDAITMRWLSYIKMFDFEIRHVEGKKHIVPDALSRVDFSRVRPEENTESEEEGLPTDHFVDEFLEDGKVHFIRPTMDDRLYCQVFFNSQHYDETFRKIGKFLETLQKPEDMSRTEFQNLRARATKFLLYEGELFKRNGKEAPRRVITDKSRQLKILEELHDLEGGGHRGIEGTYQKVKMRYYWPGMYQQVRDYVQTCEDCQLQSTKREYEELHPTWTTIPWSKAGLDLVHMPKGRHEFQYIVTFRDDFSGWLEARALRTKEAKGIIKFLDEEVFTRHGSPNVIVADRGETSSEEVRDFVKSRGTKMIRTTAYHPQGNAVDERGHQSLVKALAKWCHDDQTKWPDRLKYAIWADRITVRRSTGFTPFRLIYGREAILPIELEYSSWKSIDWKYPMTTEELLECRMKQLAYHEEDINQAADKLKRERITNKLYYDARKNLRKKPLQKGDIVLIHESQLLKQFSHKLDDRWRGPYRILQKYENGSYQVQELDGSMLTEVVSGDRLKIFKERDSSLRVSNGDI
ncbi:RNase H-like domain-containing protein [Bosea sp. (in: a-proteobacteria)]|uniref:RNase H-like domain-containing protein n=1 Tax=Bosea sp. (in: a-proteobacteria) TaxID=1871050 RepID=UPI004033941B